MALKVTGLLVIILIIALYSCTPLNDAEYDLEIYHELDSISSKRIDSAYSMIVEHCDSSFKYRLPKIIDSLLSTDSLASQLTTSEP